MKFEQVYSSIDTKFETTVDQSRANRIRAAATACYGVAAFSLPISTYLREVAPQYADIISRDQMVLGGFIMGTTIMVGSATFSMYKIIKGCWCKKTYGPVEK